ncbi:UNVERIFIED_ORG: hypothetical protein J2W87_003672 [Pseudomonas putida]|jgi:hypothetical protein|nr:hypothetical protein [Pseudomonas putida]
MRHLSYFLLEGRTEIVRDEQAVSVDESSYEVSGMKKAAKVLCVAHRKLLKETLRQTARKG